MITRTPVDIFEDETGITLATRDQALDRIRKRLREVIPADRILSEELIQERRAEAEGCEIAFHNVKLKLLDWRNGRLKPAPPSLKMI